ncbi:MAG: hypothetical protein ACRD2U_01215 [Terriglobales bacterium]
MNKAKVSILVAAILMCSLQAFGQTEVEKSPPLPVGTTVPARLEKWVDARKSKVGDEVIAKTTERVKSGGRVVIPKGSKIDGHVTQAKARTKEEPTSALGIAFDRAVLKDGSEIPLELTIQAIAPGDISEVPTTGLIPATAAGSTGGMAPVTGPGASGPMSDPNAGTLGRTPSPADSVYVPADGRSATGELTPSCHGVLGIDDLALLPDTPGSAQGSLIVSQRHNVHLDGRTQLMLRVIGK